MDKGYYDYDYAKVEPVIKQKTYEESVKSDEEVEQMLGAFGWFKKKKNPISAEQLQKDIMNEEQKNGI